MLSNTENLIAVSINDKSWDRIVRSFVDYDIYYLSGYVKAFQLHGDGDPFLIHYKRDNFEGIYVMMLRQTSHSGWFDSISPYGYGGFLFQGIISQTNLQDFAQEWKLFAEKNNIISNFVRFHPALKNANQCREFMEVVDLGNTISMNLESEDVIWCNIFSKNRNMIRKAEKNGVEIHHGHGMDLFDSFIEIYNKTMDHDNALPYYYFSRDFYKSIYNDLSDNYEIFYATYNGVIISIAIIIYANHRMHYHLSGSLFEYRHVAPTNLLLYKAAIWGMENGMKSFHLGGGVGGERDNLYKFKEAFNKTGQLQFSIGKEVLDIDKYNELVSQRIKSDSSFNKDSSFFPLYRN